MEKSSPKIRKGLGKGLSALIPAKETKEETDKVLTLDLESIIPGSQQVRNDFNEERIDDLAHSIKSQGIAQPVLVRRKGAYFELIAGERRFRAAKKAGLKRIPALLKELNDKQTLEIGLVENLQRENLNPIEEAEAYQRLQAEFDLTQAEIAERVGKNRSTIANALRLLELPREVIQGLREAKITAGHARPLLKSENPVKVFREIIKRGLSVREVEKLSQNLPTKKSNPENQISAELEDLKELLTSHLSTKVSLKGTPKKGKIEINYYTTDDLERITEIITGSPL